MAEIFANSGENSDNVGIPAPRLQGIFIPGIDAPDMQDGFGLITPLGGGATTRRYTQYGISDIISPQETQLHDLATISAEGNVFNFEGLIGPQGIPGIPGAPGITQIIYVPNSNFLTALPHNIDRINDLGTTANQLVYTDKLIEYFEFTWTERWPVEDTDIEWSCVASDADGSNLVAGISNGRLYTSADGGDTWTERQPDGDVDIRWREVASDSDGSNLIAGSSKRLYTSANSGATWTERRPEGDVNRDWGVASDSDGTNLIAGASGNRLWTSADGGATWTERRPDGVDEAKNWESFASDADGSNLVAGAYPGRLWTSADGGATWTEREPEGAGDAFWDTVASDSDGSNLVAGTSIRLWTSADGGATWTERRPDGVDENKSWRAVASNSDGSILIVATYLQLWTSSNGGDTWTEELFLGTSVSGKLASCLVFDTSEQDISGPPNFRASGQTFLAGDWTINYVKIYGRRRDTAVDVGNVKLSIQGVTLDGSGNDIPDGNILASNTFDGELWNVTDEWHTITLGSSLELTEGTKYSIVLETLESPIFPGMLYWEFNNGDGNFAEGNQASRFAGTWTAQVSFDHIFEIWGIVANVYADLSWAGVASDSDGSNLVAAGDPRLFTAIGSLLYSETTWAESALTSAGRDILDDSTVAAQNTTLGFGLEDSPTLTGLTLSGLTSNRLVQSGSALASVGDLTLWIAGTANRISVADNGDGSVTLSGPQDIHTGASPIFDGGTFTSVVTGIFPTAGDHLATKEYVDLAMGAFKTFFISDVASGVGSLDLAYPHETGNAQSTITPAAMGTNDAQLIRGFITEIGEPNTTTIHSGIIEFHFHAKKGASNQKTTVIYAILSKVAANGTSNKVTISTTEDSAELTDTKTGFTLHATLAADVEVLSTDRLILDVYADVSAGAQDSAITLYMEGTDDSYFTTEVDSGIWQNYGAVLDDLNTVGQVGADSEFLVGTGAGTFAWESGVTLLNSLHLGLLYEVAYGALFFLD